MESMINIKFDGYLLNYLVNTVPVKYKWKAKKILENGDTYENIMKYFLDLNDIVYSTKTYSRYDALSFDYVIESIERQYQAKLKDIEYHKHLEKCGYDVNKIKM